MYVSTWICTGKNQLLEDFLDGMEVLARKGEPAIPWDDVIRKLEKKHGTKLL